ncbi:uncharacterized protein LOC135138374 [Zophobas morio]|uniref:uncharacterized protein LOC135138374 n=1 Tax=Zophobas morio TaxID=2755281 RepID=UPI003083C011
MNSSSDEEIRKLEEELKRIKEQIRRKKHAQGNNSILHTQQSEEKPCSSKTQADFAAEGTNQHMKEVTEERIYPKKIGQIEAETTDRHFLETTFRKRPGTTDKGKKYEDMLTANVILQLVSNDKIKDLHISSNNENFGDFDDFVIEVETHRGIQTKALQLKHSSRGNLSISQLVSKTGNFSITKYFNSFQKIKNKEAQFILFTNNGLEVSDKTQFKLEGEELHLKPIKVSIAEDSVDSLRISENISYYYRFQIVEEKSTKQNPEKIQQYQKFFERFRLYTNQETLESLTKSTMKRFTTMFCSNEDVFDTYFKFISDWSMQEGKKDKLNKKFMQRVIALRLLSSHVESFAFGSVSDEMKILRDAICFFDITLLEKKGSNKVLKLWGDLDKHLDFNELNKVRSRYFLSSAYVPTIKDLDPKSLTQLLWLMDKCPLVVKEDDTIEKAIQLCRGAKFVLVGEGKRREWMKDRSVFQNLSHLESELELCEEVLQNFTISLQGKDAINLKTAFQQNEEFLKHLTVNKLLEMLNGPCCIDGPKETFPNLYIERYLSVNVIDIEYLDHVDQNTVIFLNCEENFEQLKVSEEHNLIHIDEYFNTIHSKVSNTPIVIVSKNNCSESEFQKICSETPTSKTVHWFKFLNKKNLEWIRSRGDINKLRNFKLSNYSKNEKEFWSFGSTSTNPINLIIGDPGMGKTELTKSLKNNCCSKYWTVIMNPQDVNLFSKTLEKFHTSDYLNRFESFILNEKYRHLERLDREFFKMCLKQDNVIYVWDALDEILSKNLNAASDLILMLSRNGVIQWVTARRHLTTFLETKFNVLSVSINQFSELEQEDYIRKRLSSLISSVDMERTVEKIKSTFAFTKHVDILGIPLQIFMLTEIFLQNKETYLDLFNNTFLLTDLYRYFIDGKFKIFFGGKVPLKGDYWEEEVRKKKEDKLKQYEKFALGLIFPEEILKELKIECSQDANLVCEDFATVGIVTGLQNGISQFLHVSFAEYFVASYFSKNFEVIRRDIFFHQKYNNVRFFFDMIVGQNSPVHIAILNRNFDELRSYNDEMIQCKDGGGRSALHLICSWGQRHRRLKVQEKRDGYVIEQALKFSDSLETREYFEALLFLISKCDISEEDLLCKITPLACCRESESLAAELELLQSRKLPFQRSYSKSDIINILYYCTRLGYDEAMKTVIFENFGSCYLEVNFITEYDYGSPLLMACQKGYASIVEYLLKCGAKINEADIHGWTPLYAVSSNGHKDIVECLVKCGAEINRANKYGQTPLYAASSEGHQKIAEYLVKCGADINLADAAGSTPLYTASSKGHEEIVKCLVIGGAEINRANNEGWTPLQAASSEGHEKTVQCLVKGGAEINRANNKGWTPLYIASSKGHENIVKSLITGGAKINHVTNDGWTPLYVASSKGYATIVEYLVKYGAEINHADAAGWTPLYTAASKGDEKIVECLVKCGAEVNRANNDGWTPLSAASSEGHGKIVECLVKCWAEINRANEYGWTPLYVASSKGHKKIVETLVKCGAEINHASEYGWTPLNAASSKGHKTVVESLVKSGAEINRANINGWTPLYTASWNGHEHIAEYLVKSGAEINHPEKDGRTPLNAAASNRHTKIVENLVKHGAEIDRADDDGETPLYTAASNGHEEIVECLVKYGAEVNRADKYGETPLNVACSNGHDKIVECLVKHGADVNRPDNNGWSPLTAASARGHEKIFECLVKCGAEIDRADDNGWTPLYAACSNGHKEIVESLVKYGAEIDRARNDSETPLYAASCNGHERIVEWLAKSGADVNRADKDGWTPLYAACSKGHEKIVECLVKCGAEVNRANNDGQTPVCEATMNRHAKIVKFLVANGAGE